LRDRLFTALKVVISLGLIAYLFSRVNLAEVWRLITAADVVLLLLALALSLAYAVLDETHQHFVPGRQFAVADLLLDAEGSILALAALRALLA